MNDLLPSASLFGTLIIVIGAMSLVGFLVIVLVMVRGKWQVTNDAFIMGYSSIPLRSIKRIWSDHGVFGERIGKRLDYTYLWMELQKSENRIVRQPIASNSGPLLDWHQPAKAYRLQVAIFALKEKLPPGVVEESALEFARQIAK